MPWLLLNGLLNELVQMTGSIPIIVIGWRSRTKSATKRGHSNTLLLLLQWDSRTRRIE
jgi:hypothetical protein